MNEKWDGLWHDRTLIVVDSSGKEVECIITDIRWGEVTPHEALYHDTWIPVKKVGRRTYFHQLEEDHGTEPLN